MEDNALTGTIPSLSTDILGELGPGYVAITLSPQDTVALRIDVSFVSFPF